MTVTWVLMFLMVFREAPCVEAVDSLLRRSDSFVLATPVIFDQDVLMLQSLRPWHILSL